MQPESGKNRGCKSYFNTVSYDDDNDKNKRE